MSAGGTPVIVVIGMHRSGTSLCGNMLHGMGADMGAADFNLGPSNARGHWERPELVHINDLILAYFNRSWGSAAHILTLPEQWLLDPRVQTLRRQAGHALAMKLRGPRPFGFKDPRTTLLLPFWRLVLADIGARPVLVFCVRDPAQVARSLVRRDGMESGQAAYRWLMYNRAGIEAVGDDPVCIIPYESWFTDAVGTAARLARDTGLGAPLDDAVAHIVAADLRHDDEAAPHPGRLLARLHRKLVANAPHPRLHQDLRDFAAVLSDCAAQAEPLLIDIEVLRVRLAEHKRVVGDLQGLVHRLRAELAAKSQLFPA